MMSIQNKSVSVSDVMLGNEKFPTVGPQTIVKVALEQMDLFRLGIVCIVDDDRQLLGILTDGDVRRKLLSVQKPLPAFFVDDALRHAIADPVAVSGKMDLADAVSLMEEHQVWDLPVVDKEGLVGLLHLHPAVKALLGA
jgi:arabinose-5-phosphate isomerase